MLCIVLQRAKVRCSLLHCGAVRCSMLQWDAIAIHRNGRLLQLPCSAVCGSACSVLQSAAACCNMLQCVAVCCSVLHSVL